MNAAAGADKESMQVTVPASNGSRMSAGDVLDALEKAWKESALVRELTITDTRELYRELENGEKHGPLKGALTRSCSRRTVCAPLSK